MIDAPTFAEKKDFISLLSDDCILDVALRLDHNDLDELSILSKRISKLSCLSRSRAVTIVANTINVYQPNDEEFQFSIMYDKYIMTLNSDESCHPIFKKWKQENCFRKLKERIPTQQTISDKVTEEAWHLLRRFNFECCVFSSISIDDHFVTLMERLSQSSTFIYFRIVRCTFDSNLSIAGRERFMSVLLSMKHARMELNFIGDASFLDVEFLKKHAIAENLSNLEIKSDRYPPLHCDDELERLLPKFNVLIMPRLCVNSNGLMALIVKRLRLRKRGHWVFEMTRPINQVEIENVLSSDLTYERPTNLHCITLALSKHCVCISFSPTKNALNAAFCAPNGSQ